MVPGAKASRPFICLFRHPIALYISRLHESCSARAAFDPNKPFTVNALTLTLTELMQTLLSGFTKRRSVTNLLGGPNLSECSWKIRVAYANERESKVRPKASLAVSNRGQRKIVPRLNTSILFITSSPILHFGFLDISLLLPLRELDCNYTKSRREASTYLLSSTLAWTMTTSLRRLWTGAVQIYSLRSLPIESSCSSVRVAHATSRAWKTRIDPL
jgi:hypothetical protein